MSTQPRGNPDKPYLPSGDELLRNVADELGVSLTKLHRLMRLLEIEARRVSRFSVLSYKERRLLETEVRLGDDWFVRPDWREWYACPDRESEESESRLFVRVGRLARLTGYTRRRLNQIGRGEQPLVRSMVRDGKRYLDVGSLIDYLRNLSGSATPLTPLVKVNERGFTIECTKRYGPRDMDQELDDDPLGGIQ